MFAVVLAFSVLADGHLRSKAEPTKSKAERKRWTTITHLAQIAIPLGRTIAACAVAYHMTSAAILACYLIAWIDVGAAIVSAAILILAPRSRECRQTLARFRVGIVDGAGAAEHTVTATRIGLALFAPVASLAFTLRTAQLYLALSVPAAVSLAHAILASVARVVARALAVRDTVLVLLADAVILANQLVAILAILAIISGRANACLGAVCGYRAFRPIVAQFTAIRHRDVAPFAGPILRAIAHERRFLVSGTIVRCVHIACTVIHAEARAAIMFAEFAIEIERTNATWAAIDDVAFALVALERTRARIGRHALAQQTIADRHLIQAIRTFADAPIGVRGRQQAHKAITARAPLAWISTCEPKQLMMRQPSRRPAQLCQH